MKVEEESNEITISQRVVTILGCVFFFFRNNNNKNSREKHYIYVFPCLFVVSSLLPDAVLSCFCFHYVPLLLHWVDVVLCWWWDVDVDVAAYIDSPTKQANSHSVCFNFIKFK